MRFLRKNVMADYWMNLLVCILAALNIICEGHMDTNSVQPTFVDGAVSKGAVCLGGGPPAYQHDKGCGEGANNWIVHLEGGGWCVNDTQCHKRGTWSLKAPKDYGGIQSPNAIINPYFYNWNRVVIRNCDFGSFLADVEEPTGNNVYRRGARIFKVVVEDLLEKGLKNASNIMFTGNSAGGLANMFHCDTFRAMVPNVPRVKCVVDAGFFIHGKQLPGLQRREQDVLSIVKYHELAKQLPKACTSKMEPHLCMFPEYFVGNVQTPLFMVQSAFDSYQIKYRLEHAMPDWEKCYNNQELCTPAEQKVIKDFRKALVNALHKSGYTSSLDRGMFVDSCTVHDEIMDIDNKWNSRGFFLNNKTIQQAVADWFFDRSFLQVIDKIDFPRNCTI